MFLAWNDYVMSVSQTSPVGDMMTLKSRQMIVPKLYFVDELRVGCKLCQKLQIPLVLLLSMEWSTIFLL